MRLSELNQRLVELKELQRHRRKLQNHLESALDRLEGERARLADLEAVLNKEGRDIQRLENLSLAGLFYTILGSKEEQLQKERQEHLVAKLKRDQCRHAVDSLSREVEGLREQLSGLEDVDVRYQSVLAQKEDFLSHSDDERARHLVALSEQLADAQSEAREVREAVEAGRAAQAGLNHVVDALQSASNWGVWDVFGGGLLATAAKHSRMDEARDAAHQVQDLLRRFQRELADLGSGADAIIAEVGSFETFADYFFDGLIVDWIVQSKIDRSLSNARAVYGRVVDVLAELERRQANVQERIAHLKETKQEFLERAE